VGLAAASGLAAARLAKGGARVPLAAATRGWEEATGGSFAEPDPAERAIEQNWIKAWPCCLQTHGAIECASRVGEPRELTVRVHPVSLQAAAYGPRPEDGLQAKFSIPYLTAWTLQHGPPEVDSFGAVDPGICELAERIEVETDPGLLESECALRSPGGEELARVEAALGSPARPMDEGALKAKIESLAGPELSGVLDDLERPASEILRIAID
jgi:2-methylcitrate dehydratase PrpD